ncbi:MAG TPA: hypothetical protein VGN65_09515 [Casimicrobiaceae bacterium]
MIAVIWVASIRGELRSRARVHGEMHIGRLRQEFAKIPVPLEVKPIRDAIVRAKVGSALVEERYSGRVALDDVLDGYRRNLVKQDWRFIGQRSNGNGFMASFCKGEYEATLETHAEKAYSYYDFAMAWSEISIEECTSP